LKKVLATLLGRFGARGIVPHFPPSLRLYVPETRPRSQFTMQRPGLESNSRPAGTQADALATRSRAGERMVSILRALLYGSSTLPLFSAAEASCCCHSMFACRTKSGADDIIINETRAIAAAKNLKGKYSMSRWRKPSILLLRPVFPYPAADSLGSAPCWSLSCFI